jgi:hypothetical protein
VIADTQGNVSTSSEYVTYNPISRSYRIKRLNRKNAKELEEIERQWGATPSVSYPFKSTPVIIRKDNVNQNKKEIKKLKILH